MGVQIRLCKVAKSRTKIESESVYTKNIDCFKGEEVV